MFSSIETSQFVLVPTKKERAKCTSAGVSILYFFWFFFPLMFSAFFGVTALWLDSLTLERKTAALCCRRERGSMTYEKIAEGLEEVFLEYKVHSKVVKVITDNGSNFLKAFR